MSRSRHQRHRSGPARFFQVVLLGMGCSVLSAVVSPTMGQTQYGAPVPPLVPGADPMLQGPLPTYGAPVTPAEVPTFWQVNPGENYGAGVPAYQAPAYQDGTSIYGAPVYGTPVQQGAVYGAPVDGGSPIDGQVIGGELLPVMDGGQQIIESIVPPADAEPEEELRPFNPVWYNPISWIGPYWDGSFELGLNGSSGNADAQSLRTGVSLSRETQRTNWDIDFVYNKNEANDEITQNNALFTTNWDFKMRNPRWTWFTKLGLEWDEFKNFDSRLFANTGLGYLLIDTDATQFRPRFGAGVSREFGGDDEEVKPEAVFGFDFSRQISSRQQFNATVDYFPVFDDFSDYRVLTDVSWELVLDEVNNLSLKVGVIDRYDSTPNGAEPNDVDYSVLLLWSL